MAQPIAWWKICEHPLVQGAHRLVSLIVVPIGLGLLYWFAGTFDGMRLEMRELKTAVTLEIASLKSRDAEILSRLEWLERR